MEHNPNRKAGVPWAVVIVGLLAVYVLSAGPAMWLQWKADIEFAQSIFYEPLHWLWRNNETFRGVMLWYLCLWVPDPGAL